MKKNFSLAALAAMALSLGFTACNDDNNSSGSFKETYIARYDFSGTTQAERDIIIKAYNAAFGVADSVTSPQITIVGKDSTDCMQKFLKLMEAPQQTVSNLNIESDMDPVIHVFNSNQYPVYIFSFNTKDNATYNECIPFIKKDNIDTYVHQFWIYNSPDQIESNKAIDNDYLEFASCDVNKGVYANSNYVFICGRTTSNPHEAIRDVIIVNSKGSEEAPPEKISYSGRTYVRAEPWQYKYNTYYIDADLNSGTTGDPLYLYYTKDWDDYRSHILCTTHLSICYSYSQYFFMKYYTEDPVSQYSGFGKLTKQGYTVEFAPMVSFNNNTQTYEKNNDGCNLNYNLLLGFSPKLKLWCVYENR